MSAYVPVPPPTPIGVANEARKANARQRRRWRAALADGTLTLDEFLQFAATPRGRHFRKFKLIEVLTDQPGWSRARARRALDRFLEAVAVESTTPRSRIPSASDATVGWLVSGHRPADLWRWWWRCVDDPVSPWEGFPYRPAP